MAATSSSSSTIAAVAVVITTIALQRLFVARRWRKRLGNFPFSTPWFLPSLDLLHLIRAGSIGKFLQNRSAALGTDVYYIRLPGSKGATLCLSNPADQAEILRKEGKLKFTVGLPETIKKTHGPGSLQLMSGEKHNFFRKIFSSLLSPAALQAYTPHFFQAFTSMWRELEEQCEGSKGPVVIQDAICKTQFFLMAKILYGMTPENTPTELMLQMRDDFEAQLEGHFAPPNSGKFRKAAEASQRLHKILAEKFDAVLGKKHALLLEENVDGNGRGNKGGGTSNIPVGNAMETVADALIKEGVDRDPKVIADVIDNLDLLLEASHGTTMNVTTSTLYFLNHSKNSDKLKKLREEARAQLSIDQEFPTFDKLKAGMPYAAAVIKETMRLAPMAEAVTFVANDDAPFIFKGQQIQGPIKFMLPWDHFLMDPRLFPRPEEFLPERWIPTSGLYVSEEARAAYTVFGMGRHVCLGNQLAMLVMKSSLYCFVRDETRGIQFDEEKVLPKLGNFPAYSISDGFPGRVSKIK